MNNTDNGQADETMQDEGDLALKYGEPADIRNTRLEGAAHALVTRLRAWDGGRPDVGLPVDLDDLCEQVEDAIALAQTAVVPVPKLLEVTGNVDERELAARYVEQKESACRTYAQRHPRLADEFNQAAEMFRVTASDFRNGLHLPDIQVTGRVIPYNETLDTGLRHEDNLRRFFEDVYARNRKAGWWTNIETGEPKKRNVGELFILMVTELVEAYKAYVANENDDKLPDHPGVGVEMGDLLIRIADFCGAALAGNVIEYDPLTDNPGDEMFQEIAEIALRYESIRKTPAAIGQPETADFLPPMDIGMMVDQKLAFNANRPDHKIENRLKEDGKRT